MRISQAWRSHVHERGHVGVATEPQGLTRELSTVICMYFTSVFHDLFDQSTGVFDDAGRLHSVRREGRHKGPCTCAALAPALQEEILKGHERKRRQDGHTNDLQWDPKLDPAHVNQHRSRNKASQ